MITLDVNGRVFHVQFRHARNLSKVEAITTCAIVVGENDPGPELKDLIAFTALGTAICWPGDQFARRRGRLKAFANALDHCSALREVGLELFRAYMRLDPDPPPRLARAKLADAIKRARWEAGWEKRRQRETARLQAEARANYRAAIAVERTEGAS